MDKREQVQNESVEVALQNPRCTLAISMGVGKTLIGLRYLQALYLNNRIPLNKGILVVGPKVSVFKTWKAEAVKHGILKDLTDRIEYVTYLSLNKKNPNDYYIVIFDEVHNLLYKHLAFLTFYTGRILGLTGTPPRYEKGEKGKMVESACPVKYTYIVDEAVEDDILNDYRILVHKMSLSSVKNIKVLKKDGGHFYKSELDDYNYWTEQIDLSPGKAAHIPTIMRMKSLMNGPTKEAYAKRLALSIDEKCLIFCNTQEQAERLSPHSIHANNPNSEANLEKLNKGEILQASCVLQISEGINVKDLRVGIILHAYGNERKSAQRIGRFLRLSPDDISVIHIFCYRNTIDELWVEEALKDLDPTKIKYFEV